MTGKELWDLSGSRKCGLVFPGQFLAIHHYSLGNDPADLYTRID
jgi:hypothetical protein